MALRYFNPIGAHPSSLIGELPLGTTLILVPIITQTAAGLRDSLTVFGNTYPTPDGSCVRDFIHVVDLAKAHVKALETLAEQKARYYDVYNIGAGKGHSILEVIKIFEKTTGVKIPYTIGPRRTGDVISTYASVNKANRLLNWKAEKSLAEGLKDAWHWQQKIK
jgi:UDP-glucose 4-epimerase